MKTQAEIIIKAKAYAKSIGNEDGTSAYDYVMGYNQCQEDMAKETNNKCTFFLAKDKPSTSSNSICICGKEKYLH
jgi:hypothetical protein